MGRGLLAGVLGCALASQALGAAYLFEGGRYEQDFEGLQWEANGSTQASDFGFAESGTLGWSSGSASASSSYWFRQSSTEVYTGARCGAPFIPPGTTALPDKSYARPYTSGAFYTSLYLTNNTGATIETAEIGYTLESWLDPTAPLSSSSPGRLYKTVGILAGATPPLPAFGTRTEIETFSFVAANAAGDEIHRSITLTGLGLDNGETLALTWYVPSAARDLGHIYGLDDVFVAVPEPSVVMMATGVIVAALSLRRRAVA